MASVLGALMACGEPVAQDPTHGLTAAAAECKDPTMIGSLVADGANVDGTGITGNPLNEAALNGHVECVRALLGAGADPMVISMPESGSGGKKYGSRPLLAVQQALQIASRYEGTPDNVRENAPAAVQGVLERNVAVADYQAIVGLLKDAEAQRAASAAP